MAEIKDMKIKLISIVKHGANQKEIIYKDAKFAECLRVNFAKNDEEQGVVYGIVYAPNEIDAQGDYSTSDEIKKAAYTFMKEQDMHCVDVNHNFEYANAYICESWIVKSKDEFFSEVGAWAVGIKLEDENLRNMVKSGELNGLSMYGSGILKENEPNFYEKMKNEIISFFEKRDKTLKKGENVEKESIKDESTLAKSVDELSKEVAALKAEISKSKVSLQELMSKSKQDESIQNIEKSASKGIL